MKLGKYELLRSLFPFMVWGDQKVMAAAGALPEAAYYLDRGVSKGGIHDLLVHMMGAQQAWLDRMHGRHVAAMITAKDFPTRQALAAHWPGLHEQFLAFLNAQTEATLLAPFTYTNTQGITSTLPLGEVLTHVADHGTYHRGQLNSMFKQAGAAIVPLNYVSFSMEQAGR